MLVICTEKGGNFSDPHFENLSYFVQTSLDYWVQRHFLYSWDFVLHVMRYVIILIIFLNYQKNIVLFPLFDVMYGMLSNLEIGWHYKRLVRCISQALARNPKARHRS